MLALKGEQATLDWLKAMKTNFVAYKGNSTVMKAVNAGQIDGGVMYHYYRFVESVKNRRKQQKHPTVLLQTPGSGRLRQHFRWRCAGFQQT